MTDTLWTKQDVADFLRVDPRTVERMGLPRVPFDVQPGRKKPIVRYDPAEIRDWVEQRKRQHRGTTVKPKLRKAG